MPKFLSDGIFDGSSTDLIVDGNVGIGTASPSYKLDVSGSLNINANATNGIRFENDGSYTTLNADTVLRVKQRLEVWGGGTTGNSYLDVRNTSGVAQIRFNAHSDSYILTNLGIGTTSPDVKLDVHSSNVAAFFESSANEVPVSIIHTSSSISSIGFKGSTTTNEYRVRVGANGNDFIAYTSNTERLRILDNGNVGIGTTSPNAKLESEYQNDSTSAVSTATAVKSVIDNNNSVITTGKLFDGSYEISSGSGEINGNYTNATSVTLSSSEYDGDPPAVGMLLSSAGGNQTIPAGTTITGVAGNTLTFSNPITANNNSQISYQSSVTDKWGLYINGEAKNYISGNVGIRTTSTNAPLEINGFNTTSGNGEGLRITRQNLSSQYIAINEADGSKHRIQAVGDKPLIISNSATTYGIQFDTAGSERLRIDSSGKVGIGTTSPAEKLEVEGGNILVDNGQIIIDRDTAGAALIWRESDSTTIAGQLRSYTNRGDIYLYKDGVKLTEISAGFDSFIPKLHVGGTSGTTTAVLEVTGNTIINDNSATYALAVDGPISTDQYIAFLGSGVSGTADMTIDVTSNVMTFTDVSGGGKAIFNVDNVGIGTTSPSSILAISNNAPTITAISTNNSSGLRYNVAGTAQTVHRFQYGGSTLMTIRNTGNVGIGTASPATTLHVNGFARLNGGLQLNATTAQIYQIQNGALRLGTNNTERMRIAASGNIGIGTTNPGAKLHVNGTSEFSERLLFNKTVNTGSLTPAFYRSHTGFSLTTDSNYQKMVCYGYNANNNPIFQVAAKGFASDVTTAWDNDAATRFTVLAGGNVGIGTTSPSEKLAVSGGNIEIGDNAVGRKIGFDVSDSISFNSTTIAQYGMSNAGNSETGGITYSGYFGQKFFTNGTQRMVIKRYGNVGIGTTDPQEKLHVQNYTTGESHQAMFKGGAVTVGDYSYISLNNGYGSEYNKEVRLAAVAELGASNKTGFAILTSPDSNGASGHERLRVTADGNVGIGTTSPTAKLDINDSSNDVSLTNTANYAINTGSAISARHYRNVNLETPQMEWSIGGSTDLNWKKLATIVINDANYAGFGAEVEITDFSGNYGSSMAQYGDVYRGGLSIFHRAGTGIEPKQGIITINNDIAPYIRIYKIAGSGNSSYQIQVKSPGNYRQINVKLEEGIGNQVASITPHANDTNGSTSGGTAYTPDTYTNGNQFKTAFPTVTANRGNILYRLGVVNTAPSYPLDVTGTIRATGDVIAYSDIRVKENIKTIDNALDKVKALRGVEYNKIDNSEKSVGVIAQEIEEVIPEVVREDDQGMKSVAYGNITAVLIEAIKEQQKQIDELKKQLDAFTK
jgi:hypothetical protein